MRWILILALASSTASHAAELKDITRAKSTLQLELTVAKSAELDELRADCRRELESTDLPRSCFRALTIEKAAGSRPNADLDREREWLGRVCLKKARIASRFSSLKETRDLPDECQKAAAERLTDLRYRAEDEAPERLLEDKPDAD